MKYNKSILAMLLTACTFSFSACSDSYMEDMNTDPSKADIIDPNAQLTTAELQTYGRLDMVDIFRNYLYAFNQQFMGAGILHSMVVAILLIIILWDMAGH